MRGTLAPARLACAIPIAIACLRLFTLRPLPPLRNGRMRVVIEKVTPEIDGGGLTLGYVPIGGPVSVFKNRGVEGEVDVDAGCEPDARRSQAASPTEQSKARTCVTMGGF